MLDGHRVKIERRTARCCGEHTDTWVVCSCGWEENCGLGDRTSDAITGHRLTVIEDAIQRRFAPDPEDGER